MPCNDAPVFPFRKLQPATSGHIQFLLVAFEGMIDLREAIPIVRQSPYKRTFLTIHSGKGVQRLVQEIVRAGRATEYIQIPV